MWENVRFSMNSTMPLFFVMLLGYVLYQKKFLSDAFVAGANKFVFYVALPVQLFRDLAATDVRAAFDGAYVLFCFVVTLVSILGIWALAKLFLPDKRLVGEFVQVCYRSSAAILGTAFLQSIYGTAEMSSMMILGSVPLYNVMAVVILMLEGPEAAQAGSMTAKLKKSVKGILTNPTLLGIAAGFAWSLLGLPMPTMAGKTLSSIASLTSPLAPRIIVLYSGVNNLGVQKSLGWTAFQGNVAIVKKIREIYSPETTAIIVIPPLIAQKGSRMETFRNCLLQHDFGKNVHVLPLHFFLPGKDASLYTWDGLHLNALGYEAISPPLFRFLQQLLSRSSF